MSTPPRGSRQGAASPRKEPAPTEESKAPPRAVPPSPLSLRLATRAPAPDPPGAASALPALAEPGSGSVPPPLQAKLAVGRPGDAFEREADHVAERVTSEAPIAVPGRGAAAPAGEGAAPGAGARLRGMEGAGNPLSEETRAYFEPRFGRSLENVRLHTGERAGEAAESIGARAFTVGRDIAFGRGEYAPATAAGRRLLAHELTHVVQQQSRGEARVQRWVLPTDWLDYIGLAIDVGERIYIELHYDEGQEKDFQRFVNTLYFAIDGVLAALPGAGGGGVALRASHSGAVLIWRAVPASAKLTVAEQVAKQMGWTLAKATQMMNMYFRSGGGSKKSAEPSSGTGSGGTPGPSGKLSTEKYLEKRWDKGTFGSVWKSIEYHVAKHGKGLSVVEYTQRAEKAFADAAAVRSTMADLQGREAVKVVSEIFGSGLFTPLGKIIWFHPKL